jgi:hypothetical protein
VCEPATPPRPSPPRPAARPAAMAARRSPRSSARPSAPGSMNQPIETRSLRRRSWPASVAATRPRSPP